MVSKEKKYTLSGDKEKKRKRKEITEREEAKHHVFL